MGNRRGRSVTHQPQGVGAAPDESPRAKMGWLWAPWRLRRERRRGRLVVSCCWPEPVWAGRHARTPEGGGQIDVSCATGGQCRAETRAKSGSGPEQEETGLDS
jgi:hypothetical protein